MPKNNVFANGREIACKSGSGKVLAHFPDVCFTPPDKVPPTPPGVPIPYPLFSKAKDTNKGAKRVMVSKKEVMKRDSSNFKKCKGDEAAKTAKKGIISSKLTGKVFFTSWSMNVKVEKKNVVRHLDTLGSNHGSAANAAVPWPYLDTTAAELSDDHPCKKDAQREQDACGKLYEKNKSGKLLKGKTKTNICNNNSEDAKKCRKAQKCRLTPQRRGANENAFGCCKGDQAHHLVEAHSFIKKGSRKSHSGTPLDKFAKIAGAKKTYQPGDAPCVCASGNKGGNGEHADLHAVQGTLELGAIAKAKATDFAWTYADARKAGIEAHKLVFKQSNCSEDCLKKQLDNYHKDECGFEDNNSVRTVDPRLSKKNDQLKRGHESIKRKAKPIPKTNQLPSKKRKKRK